MLYEQQPDAPRHNMRRMHGNFANICAIKPDVSVSAPNTSPGRILAFFPPSIQTLPFLLPAAQWNYSLAAFAIKFYLQHVRNDIGPLCFFRSQKLIARPLFPARAVRPMRCTELQGPTPAQSSPPAQAILYQTTRSNISRDQYTGATVSKTTRV